MPQIVYESLDRPRTGSKWRCAVVGAECGIIGRRHSEFRGPDPLITEHII